MKKKVDIGNKASVIIKWNVHQSNYSKEMERSIISLMAKKYGIQEKKIKVEDSYKKLLLKLSESRSKIKIVSDYFFVAFKVCLLLAS